MNKKKTIDFQNYLREQLKNPVFKKHYNECGKQLEIAYQILSIRKQKNISQVELAKRLKTNQSNVARMESGQQNFTTDTLQKIANIFGMDLSVRFH